MIRDEIESGSVVYLNSGGAAMTVDYVVGDVVQVTWFAGMDMHRAMFQIVCLTANPAGLSGERGKVLTLVPKDSA